MSRSLLVVTFAVCLMGVMPAHAAGGASITFAENWDSIGEGGDDVNTFILMPLFTDGDFLRDPNVPWWETQAYWLPPIRGSRCQFNSPWPPVEHPRSDNVCRPSTWNDWHVHLPDNSPEAKAFSGDGALHMGRHDWVPGDSSYDSYTTGSLAAAVSPPIDLGPNGGLMKFWHIIALADPRTFNVPYGTAADRGVVQVSVVDSTGEPLSPWQNIDAFQNGYAQEALGPYFSNCLFDPVDDGSVEDDFFSWGEPFGPSSTCYPADAAFSPKPVFSFMGDWTSTDPTQGPDARDLRAGGGGEYGSTGNLGRGVWVQSVFDLKDFAGQIVRVRFLVSGIEVAPEISWAQIFGNILENGVRGWMVDDFQIINTTPVMEVQQLIDDVLALGLPRGVEGGLVRKLEAAWDILNDGVDNDAAAINKLNDFIDQVNAALNAGKISKGRADMLIRAATTIKLWLMA